MGIPGIRSFLFGSLRDREARLKSLQTRLDEESLNMKALAQAGAELEALRERSLPPNPYDAQRLYQAWLTDTAQMAGLQDLKVVPGRRVPRRDVYTAVLVSLDARAPAENLQQFLAYFYQADLPHRIAGLTVQPQESKGDPLFEVTLTTEALAFHGLDNRRHLFPQTELKVEFQSGNEPQTIEVADASEFPADAAFRIRVGGEYLTVTSTQGPRWDVLGGRDGTQPQSHSAGAVVELAPLHPAYADRSWEISGELLTGLFVKPSPPPSPSPPVSPDPDPEPVASTEDAAADTRLTASIRVDGRPQAWLRNRRSGERTLLHEGARLTVSDIQAEVVDIAPDHVTLRNEQTTWRLRMGDNLRSMETIADTTARAIPEQAVDRTGENRVKEHAASGNSAAGNEAAVSTEQ